VKERLFVGINFSRVIKGTQVDMACDTDFAMYYSVFTEIRIAFIMSEK
jgi:hypothetical protein